ncbi:MAG TPA: saccharopine dehydrogenase C-terminal domain-containing protein [Flavobacteriales bacterium]|nr:saccharopine dehydrogenase C-terminal domain-containing protein [Flavobacteriales bacterium]HMR28932.1 saccharopine dehydrogenase C-terminal domain-containing protein [Flavobacteriales bacterium]
MRTILILGAGRSASALIAQLIHDASREAWRITVVDRDLAHAQALVAGGAEVARAEQGDASDPAVRAPLIAGHDLVISMLPAFMHVDVVKDCLRLKRHVITPSYVPDALWPLDADAKAAGLIFLNELGLDPGIDHMSAMRILDRIRAEGGRMEAFESYCGGLIAPESDDNPWGYKFTWNPRNVVLAGQGGMARYIKDGSYKYLPYHRLFRETVRVSVPGYGAFDGYANRDSLKYRKHYGLEEIPTLVRGTLRKAGFCAAWDTFVQLGCTDDSFPMELRPNATWAEFVESFLPHDVKRDVRANLAHTLGLDPKGEVMSKLDWLGLFGRERIGVQGLSPAATLQHLLEAKWKLGPADKDMVVMWHRFRYTVEDLHQELQASLVVLGDDPVRTGMAKTVGLPLAFAARLVLGGAVKDRGVLLPITPEIYDPILDALEAAGIVFNEEEVEN